MGFPPSLLLSYMEVFSKSINYCVFVPWFPFRAQEREKDFAASQQKEPLPSQTFFLLFGEKWKPQTPRTLFARSFSRFFFHHCSVFSFFFFLFHMLMIIMSLKIFSPSPSQHPISSLPDDLSTHLSLSLSLSLSRIPFSPLEQTLSLSLSVLPRCSYTRRSKCPKSSLQRTK